MGREGLRAREPVEQLGLAHQQLGEQLAAGAQAHQVREQLGLAREEIQVGGARARRRDEALELAERFVGVRALPERVEQHREEPGDRAARGGRIRDERPAFQDPAQVLARAVRIREAGGLERGVARDAHRRRGGRGRRREELAEGPVHQGGDAPVVGDEAPGRRRGRPRDAHAAGQEAERHRLLRQGVRLELVDDLEAVLDRPEIHEGEAQLAPERGRQVAALGEAEDRPQAVPLAEPRIVAPVEELERLHQELDLADAPAPELHVAASRVLAAERTVDLSLHPAHVPHDVRIEAGTIDE